MGSVEARLRKEEEERWEGVALGIQWRKQESKFEGGGGEQWDGKLEGMDGEIETGNGTTFCRRKRIA